MSRAPLQGLSESKKFRAWTKCKDSRRATRFAQTISPSALTSMPGTSRFTKTLPKSPCPHPPVPQKGSRNGACFLLYRLGKSSNDQLRKTEARRKALLCVSPSSRAFSRFLSLFCFTELPTGSTKEAKRTVWIAFLRAGRCGSCDFGGIRWNFLGVGKCC